MRKDERYPAIADVGEICKCGYQFKVREGVWRDKYSEEIIVCKECAKAVVF